MQVLELDLQLYPPNIRKLKDVKLPKQHQQHKKQQQHSKHAQRASSVQQQEHQSPSRLQRALSSQLITTLASAPSLRHYLQPGEAGKIPEQQMKDASKADGAIVISSKATYPELGTVRVALWWAPTWRNHAFDVAEKVSFCLLPGEVKVSFQQHVLLPARLLESQMHSAASAMLCTWPRYCSLS